MRSGASVSDISAGMFAAYAIVAALLHRERTGEGQMIDTSLIEASISLLTYQAGRFFVTGANPPRLANAHPSIVPYDCYRTADGWVTIAVMNERMWERFCEALDLRDLLSDQRFASNADRVGSRDALNELLRERLGRIPTGDLVSLLEGAGVPCAEVRDLSAVFADRQVQHLGMRQTVRHPVTGDIEVVSPPYRLSVSPPAVEKPPPRLGEHTERWLSELGHSRREIDELRKEDVI
jgi:crotonobetainyl-CoA:carnitine CoA-transferase CaiB-like acyl-CoA transferase